MSLAGLVGRNLRRNLRRTLLTATTIALATFIFTVLVSVPASMDRIVSDASATLRLVVMNRTAPWYDLPARYCGQIREMPGCVACMAITGWPATYRDARDEIFAVAEGLEAADVFPDYDLSGAARQAMEHERRGAWVGRVLMAKYRWKPGQEVTLRGAGADHLQLSFVVLGELPSKRYPNVFVFRRDYLAEARKAAGHPDDDIAWNLFVRVDRAEHMGALAKEIDDYFRNSDYETRTVTESDALAGGLSSLGNVRAIVFGLCTVVVLAVLLIAANSTAMTVRERSSEVAVVRALGFSRLKVAALLFGECALIGLLGGAVGAAAALWMFAGGVTLGAVLSGNGALWVTPAGTLAALGAALAVSVLSALIPVTSALRIPPAAAFGKVA